MTILEMVDRSTDDIITSVLAASGRDGGGAWRPIVRLEVLILAMDIIISLHSPPDGRHEVFQALMADGDGRKSKRRKSSPGAKVGKPYTFSDANDCKSTKPRKA